MATQSSIKLPMINLSNLELLIPGSPEWASVKRQVHEALEEYGFFEAVYDVIPPELNRQLFASSKQLFDLPLATKHIRNSSAKPFRGYIPLHPDPSASLYEAMTIGDAPDVKEEVETFTKSLWPKGNASFCKTVHSYVQQLVLLDQAIRRMILESLGVDKYLDEHINSNEYSFMMMRYAPPGTNDARVGAVPHTDKNTLTIVYQHQIGGLQIQTKDGEWIDIKPSPNTFAVFMGDSFMAWTNGRVHSALHRVMMTGSEARYSVGLFSLPKSGYTVKAPEELVDEEHPRLFKPYDHIEFQRFCSTPEGFTCESPIKTYCGVLSSDL